MKIQKPKFFAGAVIAMLLIAGYSEYKDYKLKQEQKKGKILEQTIEDVDFEDYFIPSDRNLYDEIQKKSGK